MNRILKIVMGMVFLAIPVCNASAQASQLSFVQGLPSNAGKNLRVYVDVCATDALLAVDQTYTPTISVSNNGGVAFSSNPASAIAPVNGCVRFEIVPLDTGFLNLSFNTSFFAPISTGNIRVDSFAIPVTDMVGEIFYPGNDPGNLPLYQTYADTLNNAWERRLGGACNDSVPDAFLPIFGSISFNASTYEGEITNLLILEADSFTGKPYTGNVDYKVVNMKGSEFSGIKGEHHTSGVTFLSPSQVLQDSAPMPASLIANGDNNRFREETGDFDSRNGLLFSFSQPVTQFGMFVGDMENNPGSTPAEMVLFHGDVELRRDTLPTRSSALEQSNSPSPCGSYPGCGNRATIWVEFFGAPVTDMLLIVGDDNSAGGFGFGLTEHLSFVGVSMGGDCLEEVLRQINMGLHVTHTQAGNLLTWTILNESEGLKFDLQKGSSASKLEYFARVSADGMHTYQFLDSVTSLGEVFYRIKMSDRQGGIGYSETIRSVSHSVDGLLWATHTRVNDGFLWLSLLAEMDQTASVRLINLQGKLLLEQEIHLKQGMNESKIPLGMSPGGFYMLEVISSKGRLWQKLRF